VQGRKMHGEIIAGHKSQLVLLSWQFWMQD